MSRSWNTFAWILATTGCSYQIYKISSLFLEHDTVNQVTVSRNIPVRPPMIVICFEDYPHLMVNNTAEYYDGDISPHEILHHAIPTDQVIFIFGYLKDSRAMNYEASKLVQIKIYLKSESSICYTLSVPSNITVTTNLRSSRRIFGDETMSYLLKRPFLTGGIKSGCLWKIYAHAPDLSFYGTSNNLVKVTADNNGGMVYYLLISYDYVRSEALPYPFKTNCVDYRTRGKESRAHCYDSCVVSKTMRRFQRIPKAILAGIDVSDKYLPIQNRFNESFEKEYAEIEEQCNKISRNDDCRSETYIIKLVESKFETQQEASLGVVDSGSPSIVVISKATIETIDYVTYVLSCLSFWFAFSPLLLLTQGFAFEFVVKKFSQTKPRSSRDGIWATKGAREFLVRELPGVLKDMETSDRR